MRVVLDIIRVKFGGIFIMSKLLKNMVGKLLDLFMVIEVYIQITILI